MSDARPIPSDLGFRLDRWRRAVQLCLDSPRTAGRTLPGGGAR